MHFSIITHFLFLRKHMGIPVSQLCASFPHPSLPLRVGLLIFPTEKAVDLPEVSSHNAATFHTARLLQ